MPVLFAARLLLYVQLLSRVKYVTSEWEFSSHDYTGTNFSILFLAGCDGYKAAVDAVKTANAARSWMAKISNQQYNIVEMKFNPAAIDSTGLFTGVTTKVQIFGKEFTFAINQAINPYVPGITGPIVAQQALDLFIKSS